MQLRQGELLFNGFLLLVKKECCKPSLAMQSSNVVLLLIPICWDFTCYICSKFELLRHVLFDKLASLAFLCDKESIETFVENFKGNPFNHHPKEIWFYNTC